MSVTTESTNTSNEIRRSRALAAATAGCVLFDVIWLHVPFLAFLAVPFAIAAWRYRGAHRISTFALLAWCVLFIAIGVNYAVTNGFHDPAEPGRAVKAINPGDFVSVYLGTPAAAWLAVCLARIGFRRPARQPEVAPA